MEAESKQREFDLEALKTRLATKEAEVAVAKREQEEAEKREEELKRNVDQKEMSEGNATKLLAEVTKLINAVKG